MPIRLFWLILAVGFSRLLAADVPSASPSSGANDPNTRGPSAGLMGAAGVPRGSFRSYIAPAINIPLSSRAAGVVDAIHLPEGAAVKSGQPIMSLDADQEKAEVAQAEAAVRGAKAEMDRAKAEFGRMETLHKETISSEKMYVDAKSQAEGAQARYEQALASLQLAKARLANRTITSPIDGIFLKTNKQVGEAVDRYETVARVVDVTSLEMTVFCDSRYFGRFKTGQRVEIKVFKSQEDQPVVSGVIVHTDPIIDPSSGTFRVKIKVDPSPNAVPGLTAFLITPVT